MHTIVLWFCFNGTHFSSRQWRCRTRSLAPTHLELPGGALSAGAQLVPRVPTNDSVPLILCSFVVGSLGGGWHYGRERAVRFPESPVGGGLRLAQFSEVLGVGWGLCGLSSLVLGTADLCAFGGPPLTPRDEGLPIDQGYYANPWAMHLPADQGCYAR